MGRTRACLRAHSRWVRVGSTWAGSREGPRATGRVEGASIRDPEGERGVGWDHRWAGSSGDEVRAARWTSERPLLCAGLVWGRGEVTREKGVSDQAQ